MLGSRPAFRGESSRKVWTNSERERKNEQAQLCTNEREKIEKSETKSDWETL